MTENRLQGRTAIVSGGTKGIGKAIVGRLIEEGADVLTFDRATVDLTKPDDVVTFFEEFARDIGCLDILVNNVGGVRDFGIFDQLTDMAWQSVFDDNVMTAVRLTRAALPMLLQSKHASIVNIASVAGVQAGYFNCHYGSMKAALIHLTKYLANNYGSKGVRANAVCPSTIKGGVWDRDVVNKAAMERISFQEAEAQLEIDVRSKAVLGQIGTLEDVAAMVAFLASDDARMITGSSFNVDGGTVRAI
jgi:NAD(P)-dependent dehydrogenase (short-subunit alcohol dehydrogenase family)